MKPVVTMIRHHHNEIELRDNAAICLEQAGFEIRHCHPFNGDKLVAAAENLTPTIVLGGSQNVTELDKFPYLLDEITWIKACIDHQVPVLGICLGAQLIAYSLGAEVTASVPKTCEFGFYPVKPTPSAANWLDKPMTVMQAHYQNFSLPDGAIHLASSDFSPVQAFRYGENTVALQFHPEVNDTIFDNWLHDSWSESMEGIPGAQSKHHQRQVAHKHLHKQRVWFEHMLLAMLR